MKMKNYLKLKEQKFILHLIVFIIIIKVLMENLAIFFSLGVVLFVILMGIFPFKNALINDSYYKLIIKNDWKSFWMIVIKIIILIKNKII